MNNKLKKTKYQISILRPGGNNTMLIKGLVKNPIQKKFINDQMMNLFPNVEQIGFYDFSPNMKTVVLEMAGGEFCGNALRSIAYLVLDGKDGQIIAQVSGATKKLIAGVKNGNAYAQMPIFENVDCIKTINPTTFLVELEGIAHLITNRPKKLDQQQLKRLGKQLLATNNLLTTRSACGVMFISEDKANLRIDPIVWVRDIQTLFHETACASGTAAIGLYKAKISKLPQVNLKIKQPSGFYINTLVKKNKNGFAEAQIWGQIEIISQKTIKLEVNKL